MESLRRWPASALGIVVVLTLRGSWSSWPRSSRGFSASRAYAVPTAAASRSACGALKELDATHGEIKFMRTVASRQRRGVASALLRHILSEAKRRGYTRLSLETGSMAYFEPARSLYRKFGFKECPPFADYVDDPNCVYMTLEL